MNARPGAESRRVRLLRESGVVRYRLRVAGAAVAAVRPASAPVSVRRGDHERVGDAGRAPPQRLRVSIGLAAGETPAGAAAEVWSQVLAWLGLEQGDVEWTDGSAADVVPLPPAADWLRPAGKRELWRALKSRVRVD